MTKILSKKYTCAVCGATNDYNILVSTNCFGSPDLDLRPAEMQRSTMFAWLQECPECGYVSAQVSDPTIMTKKWLKSEGYLTCDGIDFKSYLAKKFYKSYWINLECINTKGAFFAILHAAWACDDERDDENACRCRRLAIPLATRLIKKGYEKMDSLMLVRADLMRRAGQFEELIETYSKVRFEDDLYNRILQFQIERAEKKDRSCYTVDRVTRK